VIEAMPKPRPPYLQRERTRHGKWVWYVRMNRNSPRIRIHADYGSADFMAEYQAAVHGNPKPSHSLKVQIGTLEWLVQQWKKSSDWHLTKEATQRQRDNIMSRVLAVHANLQIGKITSNVMLRAREDRMATPAAANNFINTFRALFRWGMEAHPEKVKENPAASVKLLSYKGEGFTPWTLEDVQRFRARWPLGTRERLSMELLLWTGLRRGDVVKLGRQHVRNGVASIQAQKTGVDLDILILPELQQAIDAGPTGDLAYIADARGNPLTKESFGNFFRDACNAANVKCSAHGLRKLSATLLAEAGGTEKELQALFGWKTNTQSAVYTRRANNRTLAEQASLKLANSRTLETVRESENNSQPEQGVKNEKSKRGGRYWTRTSDPYDVNVVLYQLS
jgi:integrase